MIEFQCPTCARPMKVADEHAGKTGKCKGCSNPVKIPSPQAIAPRPRVVEAEVIEEDEQPQTLAKIGKGLASAGGAVAKWNQDRKELAAKRKADLAEAERIEAARPVPCPYCGEPIAKTARKCRHCNEYLNAADRPSAAPVAQAPAPVTIVNNVSSVSSAVAYAGGGPPRKRFSRIASFLLSVLIPGLGQLYQGKMLVGLLWFMFVGVGYVAYVAPGVILHILCALSALMADPYK